MVLDCEETGEGGREGPGGAIVERLGTGFEDCIILSCMVGEGC